MSYQLGKDGFVYLGTAGVEPSAETLCATEWNYTASEEGGDTLDVTTFCSSAVESVSNPGTVTEEIGYTVLTCVSTRVLDTASIAVGIDVSTCYSFLNARCTNIDTTAPIDGVVETNVTWLKT